MSKGKEGVQATGAVAFCETQHFKITTLNKHLNDSNVTFLKSLEWFY